MPYTCIKSLDPVLSTCVVLAWELLHLLQREEHYLVDHQRPETKRGSDGLLLAAWDTPPANHNMRPPLPQAQAPLPAPHISFPSTTRSCEVSQATRRSTGGQGELVASSVPKGWDMACSLLLQLLPLHAQVWGQPGAANRVLAWQARKGGW